MKTEKIAGILKAWAILCLVAGASVCLSGIGVYIHNAEVGAIVILCSFFGGILGFIINYAIANMMEAIDLIAKTNLIIANALDDFEDNVDEDDEEHDNDFSQYDEP